MSALLLFGVTVLTMGAGVVLAGAVQTPLTLLERSLLAIVSGILVGSAITFGLSMPAGLSTASVLGGPAVVVGAGIAARMLRRNPLRNWRLSFAGARAFVRGDAAAAWGAAALTAIAIAIVAVIFARTLFTPADGSISAGYATVWADWSQHLTTASSFALAGNSGFTNPLFSGSTLLYPFLPDFQSATLMTLGASPAGALAVPSALLVLVIGMLIVCVARRLGVGMWGGIVAALITFLGGGLGFVGLFSDACVGHGYTSAQCTLGYIVGHPGDAVGVVFGTLHDLPATVGAQARAYDGLPSDGGMPPLPGMQWYTPLLAWWLPQRTIVYGFAAALCVLLLVYAGMQAERRSWTPFVLAGLILALLPIVHIQTGFALAVILVVLALRHRRREWVATFAVAVVIAAPRLVQVALAPHGDAADNNAYPWLEPGWLANANAHVEASALGAVEAVGTVITQLGSRDWWGFWFVNLGLVVPLLAVVVLLSAATLVRGRVAAIARAGLRALPSPVIELLLAASIIFALCNVVVFQSWDWDNTKLLVYWYLAAGIAVGALVSRARHVWRGIAVWGLVTSMLLTGVLVMLRFGPWTPVNEQVGGPFVVADAQERAMAATVAASTPSSAVFLTYGRPNDPLLAAAGRTAVMGYYGWLWSYGTVFGTRQTDEQAMYQGCRNGCDLVQLLRRYRVDFVEVDDRVLDPGAVTPSPDLIWWARQGFPVVARSEHITVYDVRSAT